MNFNRVDQCLQRYVDNQVLPGVSYSVLLNGQLIQSNCVGYSDISAKTTLRSDHLFRVMSNTKLVTTCAVLMLMDDGLIGIDDPIEAFLPALANRRILLPSAKNSSETTAARSPMTIRHLLTHTSGLSYGLFDPGTVIYKAYQEHKVLNAHKTLKEMVEILADLPLKFEPGSSWEYSVATDVLGHVVEVVSGLSLNQFFKRRIFDPLAMQDTGFWIAPDQQARLANYYRGADLFNPLKPGLTRIEGSPYPDAYLKPFARLSGGGGLVSSLPDMTALVASLVSFDALLLKPSTIAMMMANQIPQGCEISFSKLGVIAGKGFGLGGAITLVPASDEPSACLGEFQWGGIAGTHWWISPKTGLAAILMTQRQMGFWHPFALEFKNEVYAAAGHAS